MEEQNLYQNVKKTICRMIYYDIYQDGDCIPSERKLSEDLGVSRVTVRKALKLLEEEHIIERIQGSGTRVALEYGARTGNMDIITLVAPAQNSFFSRFIDAFQTTAEELDSLVLFKQKPRRLSLEKCLFQIYEKNLKNVVLWLEDMELSQEALRKLRGMGMNFVLFDTAVHSVYADAVCLDNGNAVRELYEKLEKLGCQKIAFVGWDEHQVSSVREREETFLQLSPQGCVCRIPWRYHNHLEDLSQREIEKYLEGLTECDGILYAVGELGMLFERRFREKERIHRAAMIDEFPGAEELGIMTLEQDFQKMSEKIFGCLKKQNQKGSAWKAGVYQVKGIYQSKENDRRVDYADNGN